MKPEIGWRPWHIWGYFSGPPLRLHRGRQIPLHPQKIRHLRPPPSQPTPMLRTLWSIIQDLYSAFGPVLAFLGFLWVWWFATWLIESTS